MTRLTRRDLLAGSAAAAMGTGWPSLQVLAAPAPFSDYRALVCVFLFGGNDAWNTLVPRSPAEYDVYATSRQNLAIEREALLPITPMASDGVDYGLHPMMGGLQALFEQGRLAIINDVGPLIQPITVAEYFSGSATLPPQLFSHNDQQDQWHTLKGTSQSATGWAGRMADVLRAQVAGQQLATNISLFGNSLFQAADDTIAYVMGAGGPAAFLGFDDSGFGLEQRRAFERIIDAEYGSIYERAFAAVQRRAVSTVDLVTGALSQAPALQTAFPDSQLGVQLQTVARMIAVRDQLEMQRQVFFVAIGGFDTHDDQNDLQPGLLSDVSDAMSAFYTATEELGVADAVTTFTQSDFGRTLTSNGTGTDHAWSSVQMVMGGAVLGRQLYGQYPLLELGGAGDVGGGRFIPTLSSDQYAATLARWFGIEAADLPIVAPNIGNFAQQDLGFML
ncbi:MAG: DUF1501 domain-containing protein [Gammaproteobacteria bacterium]|nr:DUF1501 domain-containing protein [Gammaproteobacteria bacterium]